MSFTVVDWVILGIAVIGGISGAFTGFFKEFASKLGFILGLLFSLMFTKNLAPLFVNNAGFSLFWATAASYAIIFLVTYALSCFLGSVLSKLFHAIFLGFVDHMLGFVLGLIEAVIVLTLIWVLISSQNLITLGPAFSNSYLATNFLDKIAYIGKDYIDTINLA